MQYLRKGSKTSKGSSNQIRWKYHRGFRTPLLDIFASEGVIYVYIIRYMLGNNIQNKMSEK